MHSTFSPDDGPAAGLEVRDLGLSRGGRVICARLSFTVDAGARLELGGANGAGKTTFLRALAGLSSVDQGSVLWRGEVCTGTPDELTYIGHKSGLKPELSVRENLRFYLSLKPGLRLKTAAAAERVGSAIAQMGLADLADVPCSTLSEGQRRRGALARLPIEEAALWLLDEPAATLDRGGIATLQALLAEHARCGGVAVVATHQLLDEASQRLELPQTVR